MGRHLAWQVPVVALALVIAGCSSSDAGSGTDETADATTTTTAAAAANPLADKAATEYQAYAVEQTKQLVTVTKTLTDAVRAGDLAAAQAAYAPSRVPWERIEPLAGLVEEIDGKVDARVDDFAGVDDPEFTGWHRLDTCCSSRTPSRAAPRSPTNSTRTSPRSTRRCRRWRSHRVTSPSAPPN